MIHLKIYVKVKLRMLFFVLEFILSQVRAIYNAKSILKLFLFC